MITTKVHNPVQYTPDEADAIARDWELLQREHFSMRFYTPSQPFSPTRALSFARHLAAAAKSQDEAIPNMSYNPEGLAAFLVAAYFANPYFPKSRDSARDTRLCIVPPYVALAKAVADFLEFLQSRYSSTEDQSK
jgi:hypothetical protein